MVSALAGDGLPEEKVRVKGNDRKYNFNKNRRGMENWKGMKWEAERE